MQMFIILPLLASLMVLGVADQMAELKNSLESQVQKHKLKYGESCVYAVELEKGKHENSLVQMISTLSLEKGLDETKLMRDLIRISNSIATIDGTFCNGYANLQCTSNGVCDCAAMAETYGFKMSFKRDGDACLIARGSLCAPEEVMEQSRKGNPLLQNAPVQEIRCADKSSCVVKSNGQECNMETMKAEFERYMRTEMTATTDPLAFIVTKTKQGICVCKGISFIASTTLVFWSAILVFVKSFHL